MTNLVVVDTPENWPFDTPDVRLVAAREYLTSTEYFDLPGAKVFNLCRSYSYQSLGYYVSLLAEARGHRCLPTVATIQDLKSMSILRVASEDLDQLIQSSLGRLTSKRFALSIYFGRNLAKRYDQLSSRLVNLYPAPLLRAFFVRKERWQVQNINIISGSEVPPNHRGFVARVATEYFARRRAPSRRRERTRYDLAILHDPHESEPPSDERAIARFLKAARALGVSTELIEKEDYGRIAEFDALFIRETTAVNHHTYRFARRAHDENVVSIDDPESILRCTNKVYLAELLARHGIAAPRTIIAHRGNVDRLGRELGFPIILKQPDSSFSQGVVKVDDPATLDDTVREFFRSSDLLVAQEFTPTEFDWRVGILDGRPLYVCRYHMATKHWQIINRQRSDRRRHGKVEAVPVAEAPARVLRTALRATRLIGDGLYGVDLKEANGRPLVIEINDNPTIEAGCEDRVLGDGLYQNIMAVFIDRIERRRQGAPPR